MIICCVRVVVAAARGVEEGGRGEEGRASGQMTPD
jgi:hypothetical protein